MALFHSLAEPIDPAALPGLSTAVQSHVASLHSAQVTSELIAIDLADQLGERLVALIGAAASFDPASRALVVGAARYFISEDDARPDAGSPTGLDDDVEVFNYVAKKLGRVELVIEDA